MSKPFATIFLLSALTLWLAPAAVAAGFRVTPAEVKLTENFAEAQLLVTALDSAGNVNERSDDFTLRAEYRSSDPAVVAVDPSGRLTAVGNGSAMIAVTTDGVSQSIPVAVTGIEQQPRIDFVEHLLPVINKAGCNAGACHASQYGKGGLKLSVFGFDPAADWESIVRDRSGRRIDRLDPAQSLLLLKPTLAAPHGGGRRIAAGSPAHQVLEAWIAAGAPPPRQDAPQVARLIVSPQRRVGTPGLQQQLQVQAVYSDGKTKDVTGWARYDSLDPSLATISSSGHIVNRGRGQAAVMIRYEGQAEIAQIVVPYAETVDLTGWQDQNFLDVLAGAKFRELGIPPSPLCDDATFLRRAYLDAIGTLPTVDEAAAFLDATDLDKRNKLIDRLLGLTADPAQDIYNEQYTAFWTQRWADLLKISSQQLGERNMWAFHNWLKESFRVNKPTDQLVKELLTAKGNPLTNGPANFFLTSNNPYDLGESAAQLLLGVRIGCARCHHHPFEKYGQADYYGFAAFFVRVASKYQQEQGVLSSQSVVVVRSSGEMNAPRIGVVKPTPIDGSPVDHPLDRRIPLAEGLVAPGNDLFARNIANRYLRYLLGRGAINPVDDLRATNPASNPALLDALAADFRANGWDLKKLCRTIMRSRLYQLDSQPLPKNAADDRFYSHFSVKRIGAEPLLDAVNFAAGTESRFVNDQIGSTVPLGTRAIELPDATYSDLFLNTFAKPKRATVCECERTPDENLAQALHTLNGELVEAKIAHPQGRVARLLAAGKPHEEIVTELYLCTLSRRPTVEEMSLSREALSEIGDAAEYYQDLLWALLNSKQFLFVH